MISSPKMDEPQQWQFSQPVAYTQPPAPYMAAPQQWQLCQTSTYVPQPLTPGDEGWMCATAATALQHPLPMLMVPVPQQTYQGNSFAVNNVSSAMVAQCQPFPVTGCNYNPGDVAVGWQHWQPMPHAQALEPMPQVFVLVPVCSPETPSPNLQPPWSQITPCTPICFGERLPADVQQTSVQAPVSLLPFASSNTVSFAQANDQQPGSAVLLTLETSTMPESLHCKCLANNTFQEAVAQHAQPGTVERPELIELAKYVDVKDIQVEAESSMDELSDCGNVGNDHFDIHATPRDAKSYASSETSTAVSRSARRRRGRRATKAKASKTSMAIMETPVPDDLLVTAETKNEVIQQLAAGGDEVRRAVSNLRGSVLRLSLEPFGCRVVQMALDVASASEKESLVAELHNHVRLAISSPHANFVIQKVIEVLPIKSASFVAEELVTFAAEVARHRFGCRVLSRLVEHHLCGNGSAPSTNLLIEEVLLETDQLIHHNFARHVLELILEHGTEDHKQKIAKSIRGNLFHYAKNRFASYVVEKALALCKAQDTHAMASALLSDPERFLMLAVHECGTHVVKAVLKLHGECAEKAKELLVAEVDRVKSSKYGKRLLDEV